MQSVRTIIALLVLPLSAAAALPSIAVISIDFDEFSPDSAVISAASGRLERSGRFQVLDLQDDAYLETSPEDFMAGLRSLAAEETVDLFMALELLYPEQNDRTVFRNDSLITFRKVSVTVLARFYSSEGRLIGSLRNTVSREGTIPYSPDTGRMAVLASEEIAESALLEMFPVEASFTASGEEVFTIPLGRAQGIDNGTVMALVAASSGIPDDPGQYEDLRSRGLLQVMDAGENESRARLLSGRLTPGGNVTAVEQSAPASIFLEYCGVMSDVKMGQGLDPEDNAWSNNARLGVHTTKWGFSFGGGINTGGLEHSSMIGVDLLSGIRLPLSSPALGLRLLAGGEIAFHMQDVRSTEILSNATDVTVGAIADVTLEYLFSDHLGIQAGVIGSISTTADSWTVQDYTGEVRDAEPYEIYYTEMKQGPVGAHIGLMYFIF